MTQTGGLVILCAWLIFAGLLTVLAYLLLRHEQDPLQDLKRPGPDRDDDRDQGESLPADCVATTPPRTRPNRPCARYQRARCENPESAISRYDLAYFFGARRAAPVPT